MTTNSHTTLHLNLSDHNDPQDVIDVLFLQAYASGSFRRAHSVKLARVRADASMLPPGVRPVRVATTAAMRSVFAEGDGWVLRARRWPDLSGDVAVAARSSALAQRVVAEATHGISEPVAVDPHRTEIGFWYLTGRGPSRAQRLVTVSPWSDIRRNYAAAAAAAGDRLMAQQPETLSGRLLLIYGPPGTGKTSMLGAVALSWRRWCRVDCVLDPERLFDDPSYLLAVSLRAGGATARRDGDDAPDDRWRLLVLEDCDDLIRPRDGTGSGHALARLLNVTDGFVGQGRHLLVAITTNEPLTRLHPAVTRPGRCLAQVEVGHLSPSEARAWLGDDVPFGPDGASLAELYAHRRHGGATADLGARPPVGQYL